METREAIAHLYRRFGLGASEFEVSAMLPLGLDGAIHNLIAAPRAYEYPIEPYEFVWYQKVDPDMAAEYFRRWWMLRMLCTTDPLTERMTLFWHSHFAVSADKVMFGPMMLDYLLALNGNAVGKFRDLLGSVVKTPALLEYLDMGRSIKGRPNENLARELMELYTLGVGHYTEHDVKEASRALTGWGYINTFFELPGTNREKLLEAIHDDRPFAAFTDIPALHDGNVKEFLGKRGTFRGEDVLDMLAGSRANAEFIAHKLWSHFAYPDPEPATLQPVVDAYMASEGDIRQTVLAIAKSPEFYSDRCVRRRFKNPADFNIAMMRAAHLGPTILAMRTQPGTYETPLPNYLQNLLFEVLASMDRQGLSLLRPPNPAGWAEGKTWANSGAMAERMLISIPMCSGDAKGSTLLKPILQFVAEGRPKKAEDTIAHLCRYFDWSLSDNTKEVIAKVWAGSPGVYTNSLWEFAPRFNKTVHLVAAAPEAHFC